MTKGWRVALIALAMSTGTALAAPVSVPNGDFSNAANNGIVGGGVLGGSGTSPVGSGPWNGTYNAVAGLLAPPVLSIGGGHATVGGLAGINVLGLGIADNYGYFSQNLSTAYVANHHYVLTADVDVGTPLTAGILGSGNAGIALTNGSSVLASTTTSSPSLISVSLISGTKYQLVLTYDTSASVSGNIGVELFAQPQNLLTASLLSSATFSGVTLSAGEINPTATGVAPASGTPQGAVVDQPFAAPLVVKVVDADGDPVSNVSVTFTAPTTGASAALSATTVTTDASGEAQVTASANGIAGSYVITATVSGVGTSAQFALTNVGSVPTSLGNDTGTPQSAQVNAPFSTMLGTTVTDSHGNPISGVTVTFSAPNSGASATFPNGNTATTDASGNAQIAAVANTVAGSYQVTASVGSVSTTFALTNTAGPAASAAPIGGTPQNATVSQPFNVPLQVQIDDAYGNPVSGASVTFTAPSTGASSTFPPDGTTTVVTTDANGIASVDATANATSGSYTVTATSPGTSGTAFELTNAAGTVPVVVVTSGQKQSANVSAKFMCMLQLKVTSDGTTAMSGVDVTFTAPASGPSSTLTSTASSASGTQVTVTTDSNGLAAVTASANGTPGPYDINATMASDGSSLASYTLTNLDAGERLFADGFDIWPATCQ